jgi:hypothetical protein
MQALTKSKARQFAELMQAGIDKWVEAGKYAAACIDEDANFVDEVCDEFPQITPEMVLTFARVGRSEVHPYLLLSDAPGIRRLRRLPYAVQEKYAKEPVRLLVSHDGKWETLNVDVRNLTPDQASQVFGNDGVRSDAAQRAFIEDKAAKRIAPAVKANLPYRVTSRTLVVMEPVSLDRKELLRILNEMES